MERESVNNSGKKKSKPKHGCKFFKIFNPKYLFMDFVRFTGWLGMNLFLLPRYHYYDDAPKNRKIKGGAIIACNHVNYMDPPLMFVSFPTRRIFSLTTTELFKGFFYKIYFRGIGCIPIDRQTTDFKTIRKVVDYLKDDKVVLIFPEGKISDSPAEIMPIKSGIILMALRANVPIIPVYTPGTQKLFKRVDIIIGKPINLKEHLKEQYSREDIEKLSLIVRERMVTLKNRMDEILLERASKQKRRREST